MSNKRNPDKTGLTNPERFTGVGKGGSRPILDQKKADDLVNSVAGMRVFDSQIAISNGIHPATLRNWLKWGLLPNAQEPYKSFAERYAKEQIETEAQALEIIAIAAKKDWKAAAWFLEKKHSRRYGTNVPANGPTESVEVEEILKEATGQHESLTDLFSDPPPALAAAMKEKKEEILAFLESQDPKLPEST